LFVHPGSNFMLSATGVLNSPPLRVGWGRASNSLNTTCSSTAVPNANVSALRC
jgi:hypothetical protein